MYDALAALCFVLQSVHSLVRFGAIWQPCMSALSITQLSLASACSPAHACLQFEQAAKQESQRIQSLLEDGGEPDVKDVQAGDLCCACCCAAPAV